ncbi:MAG: hypothetical protein ACLT8E_01930 [Akkermansia sp.]
MGIDYKVTQGSLTALQWARVGDIKDKSGFAPTTTWIPSWP